MIPLLQPKEITVHGLEFTISKFPAVAGREIMMMYKGSLKALEEGRSAEYHQSEEMLLKLMSFVGKKIPGKDTLLMLNSKALIDNHVVSEHPWETLIEIEREVIEYNNSFFTHGRN